MKNKISFILPSFSQKSAEKIGDWILHLPELKLVADYDIDTIHWKKDITGDDHDWFSMADAIINKWDKSFGFVVWAPEQSVLELAGVLDLLFRGLGKPIVVFSAEKPEDIADEKFKMLALKSVLINAVYIAESNLAEVMILSDANLYKPNGCFWGADQHSRSIIQSVYDPLAHIDFALKIIGEHNDRQIMALPNNLPGELAKDIFIPQWVPSLAHELEWPKEKPRALLLNTDSSYWNHPEFKKLRDKVIKEELAAIWYSRQPWPEHELAKNEITVAHPNFWWAVLATQFSLAKHSSISKAIGNLHGIV